MRAQADQISLTIGRVNKPRIYTGFGTNLALSCARRVPPLEEHAKGGNRLRTILLIAVVIAVSVASAGANDCTVGLYQWVDWGDNSYSIVPGQTWEEAQAAAEQIGGYLVNISGPVENQWILENVLDPFCDESGQNIQFAYIGLYQPDPREEDEPDGGWEWVYGSDSGYRNWQDGDKPNGEPNNLNGNEHWAEMYSTHRGDGKGPGKWNDVWQDSNYGIAEMVPEPAGILVLSLGVFAIASRRRH